MLLQAYIKIDKLHFFVLDDIDIPDFYRGTISLFPPKWYSLNHCVQHVTNVAALRFLSDPMSAMTLQSYAKSDRSLVCNKWQKYVALRSYNAESEMIINIDIKHLSFVDIYTYTGRSYVIFYGLHVQYYSIVHPFNVLKLWFHHAGLHESTRIIGNI